MNVNKIDVNDSTPVELQEAFNILRTNLSCILSGEKSKIVAITSDKTADNVNFVASNLAYSFAQIEKNKVLLIDGDMRCSSLSEKFELSGKAGFADCLSGNAVKENCIVSVNGIDILPSGNKPSNPVNLLDSQANAKFCHELRESYDYIFIVLPSVCFWADCAVFAKYADGFLPVVRHNFTRFKEVKSLIRNLRIAGGKILGFVYDRAPNKRKK